MSYEALYVSEGGIGFDNIFQTGTRQVINYQTRVGRDNILEQVYTYKDFDVSLIGYLKVERAYKFGDKYVIVYSTGEDGNSCPASTFSLVYDANTESVNGVASIDGCSEIVQSFSEGNKLSVKKEGETTVVYNGEIKKN